MLEAVQGLPVRIRVCCLGRLRYTKFIEQQGLKVPRYTDGVRDAVVISRLMALRPSHPITLSQETLAL